MNDQPQWTSKIREQQATERKAQKKRRRIAAKREAIKENALSAAAENCHPDIGERDDLAVVAVIDPIEAETLVHLDRGPPVRLTNPAAAPRQRVISLRDDPIGKMAKLGRLGLGTDRDARLMAARKWQEYYDTAANERALDFSGDVVDGGGVDDIAEKRLTAVKALSRSSQILGMQNENLIYQLLAERRSLDEILKEAGLLDGSATARQKMIDAYVQIVRNCLDDLAVQFHYLIEGRGPSRPADRFDVLAQHSREPRLYAAVHAARGPT